ncbi:EpsI family protein [Marinobacter sp. EhC06]|jgi:exosortase A|uniref:exosortase A n=1 Tax=Marinobacter TaxID=2742 RepID=UPI0007D9BEC7|nr:MULTISPECIES: EpsI domain-containing exosortase [unclassified Marinobacter]OAN92175.1 EpsI family protein [Marinobacter sp. EhN04]OAN96587.1 EpsI family protein [Marinobacter sp. EhC06]
MPSELSGFKPSVWIYLTFFLLLFLPEWLEFFELWYSGTIYTHGFLVLAASGYLLFQVRDSLASLERRPSKLGFAVLLFFCAVMLVAKAADIKTIRLLCLPFLIVSWGWAIWGPRFLKLAAIPVGLLIFASPIWDDMSPIFQAITVFVNGLLLDAVGIPADIHELYITIPAGTFFVAGGCSGVRYLMVGLFLAPFYGFLYFPGYRRTVALIAIAALLSMLANWIRVFGIIVIGHVTDMQSSIIEDHEAFGWLTFLVFCLIPLFFIARWLEPRNNSPTPLERMEAKLREHQQPAEGAATRRGTVTFASITVLLVPVIFYSQTVLFEERNEGWSPSLPAAADDWRGPLRFATIWSPSFVNADFSLSGTYVSDQLERVQLQVEAYRRQAQGKELVYYRNSLFDDSEWNLTTQRSVSVPQSNGFGVDQVTESELLNLETGRRILVWSWYRIGEFSSPSRVKIKIFGGLRSLSGKSDGSFVALAAECDHVDAGCVTARAAFEKFLRDMELSL